VIIKAKVHGHVVSLVPEKQDRFEVTLEEPVTVRAFIRDHIGVNPMVFGAVVVNGTTRRLDHVLDQDSELLLLSPIAGG